MNEVGIDPVLYQKMLFVYRALEDGWSVRKLRSGKFVFKKPTSQCQREIYLEDYLRRFICYNLCMNHLVETLPWIPSALQELERSSPRSDMATFPA